MNDKDVIIAKIMQDAENEANAIKEKALNEADTIKENADLHVAGIEQRAKEITDKTVSEIKESRAVVAGIDANREISKAQAEVIDKVYAGSIEGVKKMPKAKYLALIEQMICRFAEDGDTVVIAKADKGVITASFVKKVAEKLGIKLTLSKELGDFAGGVVLSGATCDKNLTLELELEEVRKTFEDELSKILFSEEK